MVSHKGVTHESVRRKCPLLFVFARDSATQLTHYMPARRCPPLAAMAEKIKIPFIMWSKETSSFPTIQIPPAYRLSLHQNSTIAPECIPSVLHTSTNNEELLRNLPIHPVLWFRTCGNSEFVSRFNARKFVYNNDSHSLSKNIISWEIFSIGDNFNVISK